MKKDKVYFGKAESIPKIVFIIALLFFFILPIFLVGRVVFLAATGQQDKIAVEEAGEYYVPDCGRTPFSGCE